MIYAKTNSEAQDCSNQPENFLALPAPTAAQTSCYCESLKLNQRYSSENENICKNFNKEFLKNQAIVIFFGVISVSINSVIRLALKLVSKIRRYYTCVEEFNSMLKQFFLPIFINSVIVIPVLYGDIFGLKIGEILTQIFVSTESSNYKAFKDFSPEWFKKVGAAIPLTLQIQHLAVQGAHQRRENEAKAEAFAIQLRISICLDFDLLGHVLGLRGRAALRACSLRSAALDFVFIPKSKNPLKNFLVCFLLLRAETAPFRGSDV